MQRNRQQKEHGMTHVLAAFRYSMSGLRMALKETAVRHELIIVALHFSVMAVVGLSFERKFVLTLALSVIFITELLNTAIEAVVDLASPGQNSLAKKAKDLGSAAVFCALVLFFAGWGLTVLEAMR